MYFPPNLINILITTALIGITVGAIALIVLVIDDVRKDKLW